MKKQKTNKLKLSWDPEKEDSEQFDEAVQKLAQCLFPEPEDNEEGSDYPAMPLSITNKGKESIEVLGTKLLPGGKVTWHGLSKREYAAIHLRVPMSGETWLDDMIRASLESSGNLVTTSEDSPDWSDVPDYSEAPDWSDAPTWSEAPDWANWLAQDSDGRWFWHQNEPILLSVGWEPTHGKYEPAKESTSAINWRNTLQERPKDNQ